MLQKQTKQYANHGMSLECDIYTNDEAPHSQDTPVVLFFHPGGLVAWGRDCVPPWLVQVCLKRKWPLISPSYRLLPQTGSKGLMEDANAAYEFAQNWDVPSGKQRHIIVAGASGGLFMATLIAHHLQPPPLALLSLEGIPDFHHPFFNSSTQLTPEPIKHELVQPIFDGPLIVGPLSPGEPSSFHPDKLLPDGSKNASYTPSKPPQPASQPEDEGGVSRGELYDYYIYNNTWLKLVGDIDPGYEWGKKPENKEKRDKWPPTVVVHGDDDYDVPIGVSQAMRAGLGEDKVDLVVAKGQGHLFDLTKFIEDQDPGMDAIREVVTKMDAIVKQA